MKEEGCIRKIRENDSILNAGLIYEILGCTEEEMQKIRELDRNEKHDWY